MENIVWILVALFFLYWLILGIFRLFRRYHVLFVMGYLVFLTPIALLHAFFLGIFGLSNDELLRREAEQEARKQLLVEEERKKLGQ